MPTSVPATDTHELVLERTIAASADKLYRAWTDPALLSQWFCPAPWRVARAELDVRPGGGSTVVLRSPEGQEFPQQGVYLEVMPKRRLVFTDACTQAWVASGKAFMTAIISFDDLGKGCTRYTARVRHWSAVDRAQHEPMGFHQGWAKATGQLATLVATL